MVTFYHTIANGQKDFAFLLRHSHAGKTAKHVWRRTETKAESILAAK